ncbi:MAG: hypothetical protein ABW154_04260 [Dyella sp.]
MKLLPFLRFLLCLCGIATVALAYASAFSTSGQAVAQVGLGWMATFGGKHTYDLYSDPRFKKSVFVSFPHQDVYWMSGRHGRSLPAGIYYFALGGFYTYPGDEIRSTDNGGIAVDGYLEGSADASKWLLWSNASTHQGRMIFAFVFRSQSVGEEHTGELDIYTNGKTGLLPLPPDFLDTFRAWKAKIGITSFTKATLHGVGVSQPIANP